MFCILGDYACAYNGFAVNGQTGKCSEAKPKEAAGTLDCENKTEPPESEEQSREVS